MATWLASTPRRVSTTRRASGSESAKVTAALAHWLSGFGGDPVEVKPDLDQVPALAAERDAQWARVAAADFLTVAEKRVLLGLPPVPEGA